MINKHYIFISIITISALQAADDNQLKEPNISRHMSLTTLRNLDLQTQRIQFGARIAFRERTEELLTQDASTISLEELELLNTILRQEQHTKTKKMTKHFCAAVAAVGTGGLLACEALHENIPSIDLIRIFNAEEISSTSLHQCCLPEGVSCIDPNFFCLGVGLGAMLRGIVEVAQIIMQPTMKHKIEELQQVIREKKQEKSE